MGTNVDYVTQRETEPKAQLKAELGWLGFLKSWNLIGRAMSYKRDADYFMGEYNAIRSRYIKRGRKTANV